MRAVRVLAAMLMCASPAFAQTATDVARLRQAVEKGDVSAAYPLGVAYRDGIGVPKDIVEADVWIGVAGMLTPGAMGRQYALEATAFEKTFTREQTNRAMKRLVAVLTPFADAGEFVAQLVLGTFLYKGAPEWDIPKDLVDAYKWLTLASVLAPADKQNDIAGARTTVEKEMTADQIAAARQQAREWMQSFDRRRGLAAPPPVPGTVRVGGDIPEPTKLKDVKPEYPAIAQSARVQGVVILEATIGPDGKVQDATVLRSIPLLDQAAIDAVKQWAYTPTVAKGVPVAVIMTVVVSFTLK